MRILFLCTGNSCRSQMAEGFARALKPHRFEALSAGTQPHGLNPLAVKAMAEAGIDISAQRSKHIDEFAGLTLDLVVTVCDSAHESCPLMPGAIRTVHHPFDDPPRLAQAAATDAEAPPTTGASAMRSAHLSKRSPTQSARTTGVSHARANYTRHNP